MSITEQLKHANALIEEQRETLDKQSAKIRELAEKYTDNIGAVAELRGRTSQLSRAKLHLEGRVFGHMEVLRAIAH